MNGSPLEVAERLRRKSVEGRIDAADLETVAAWPLEEVTALFAAADAVRRHFKGNTVAACSIMNVKSGGCGEDCAFCAQSAHNRAAVPVQPLSRPEEVVERHGVSMAHGLDFGVVSSGRRLSEADVHSICEAVRACRGPVHASLGILPEPLLRKLREAGVTMYHHNLEAGRSFFPRICTTHTHDERVATVKAAKRAGFKVCSGGIFGLGETWRDRIELCEELRELDVDSIPLNFLVPVEGTRVAPPKESPLELLKIVSMFRLAHPARDIKVCGGRQHHLRGLHPLIFLAGANGYISGDYLTTKGGTFDEDDRMLADLGLVKRPAE
jgi:biotin synthase